MSFGKINSEKYWEERFSTNDWEKYEGGKQSAYFADLARRAFPDWFNQALKRNDWTVADWGCAEGDGTAVLAKSFPMCHFIGIDFSSAAIQKAQEKYPFCDFKTGDMTSEIANSDVIFSSNTLEHLKAPGVILKRLVAAAQKHAVILIPLHDELELSEHFSTFDEDFFPLELEGYPLSYFHIIDCQGNPLWPGEQLLVIYSNPQYLPENRSLSELFSNVAYLRLKEERNHIKTELQLEREHLETAKKTSNELNERLQEKTTQLSQVKEQLNEKADQILKLETDLNEKTEKLSQTEIQLNEQTDRFSKAEIQLNEQTVQISEATHTLNEKVTQLNKQNEQLEQLKGQITQVSELKTCLDKKKKELFDVKQQFNRKTEEMAAAEQKIDETTQSLNQMEEECRKQKQIQTALKSQLCASNEKIDASIQLLYSMLGSKQIRLIHFINRFKYQGFHSDPEERKKFRKWLFSRFQKTPDSDRRYHPLFPVIRMLEDARNLSNGMFAENTETVSSSLYLEKNRNHAKQKTMPETDNQKLQILSELYEKPDIIILAIIDYDFRHQRPQHFAQRLAQKGHRVFYVNANFSNKFSQKKLGENLWQITLVNTDFTAIYPNDWSNHLDQMKDQMDQILDKNAIRDAVVIVDYPNWVHCALYLREKYGLRIVTDYMDDFTGFLNPAEDMVRKNCEKLLQESNGVMASSEFLYNIASQYSSHVAMNRNGTEYDYFHQAWDLAKNCKKERPIIGYYGAIAEWFHAEIVCQCAERFQECEIVLVGNITAHREELERYHNIRLVGEVPYTKLLPWLASFDVCLIPFDASTDLIKATNPVKFYEYLSAGKKIVATEIPELRPYQDRFVYLENDAEKFCNAVDACLHGTDKLAAPEECFAFAKENDWDARAEVFENEALAVYPKISVIVLCYNQLDYTKKCVESVLNTTAYPNYELILVDNASSDGTADYLKGVAQEYAQVKIVLNQTNRGFAGGNNDGISIADGDYLVLLNNDTIVTRGWLTGLLKHFQNDSTVGLVGPVTNSIGNEAKIQVNYTELSKMAGFADAYTFMHMGEEYPHHGILAMFCLMISRGLYEKVGPLDEQYGIGMFEDDDYSIASEKLGYRNVLAEDVFIHHFGSVSFKKLEDSTYRAVFEQNKTYYEEKWKEPWRKPFYRPDVT